jgi:hypothetical protein
MANILFPAGKKIYGANIVPTPTNVNASGGGHAWSQLQLTWDWTGWVKPQIDSLVAAGCNTFRIMGCPYGIAGGQFSQAAHDANIMQVANYCQSIGVYFYYATPIDSDTQSTGVYPMSVMAPIFAETLKKLQALSCVIGVDVLQEANGNGSPFFNNATLLDLYGRIKRLNVTLPLTYSTNEVVTSGGGSSGWLTAIASSLDFLDFHVYYTPSDINTFSYFTSTFPDKEIVIGEFGFNQGSGTSDQIRSNMVQVLNTANSPAPQIRGALVWAATDQDDVGHGGTANMWGMTTAEFVPRNDLLNLIRGYSGGSLAKSLAGHR